MIKLTYEQLEQLPSDLIQFYVRAIAGLPIGATEFDEMKLKYPNYFV